MNDKLNIRCSTQITIYEDGMPLPPVCNDIHPQNFAVAIGRAMCNMSNGSVFTMAFGNGGHNNIGDKLPPRISSWNDTLYNEVYSEIIDATSGKIGSGNGTVPENDIQFSLFDTGPGAKIVEHSDGVSIIFTCHINNTEPTGQMDYVVNTALPVNNYFAFDEIALFTGGRQLQSTYGYQDVDIGDVNGDTKPGLNPNTQYSFKITVNNRDYNVIFATPNTNADLTMNDIVTKLNSVFEISGIPVSAIVTNLTNINPTNTFGYLRFQSDTPGNNSSVFISQFTSTNAPPYLISALAGNLQEPVNGTDAGVRMSPTNSSLEGRRMLTHLILDNKIHKASNKSYLIVYELKMKVENA